MLDQNTFTETVREVSEIIRTSATPLTREEILSYFKDMDLNEQQQETVFSYLITPHEEPEPSEEEVQKDEEGDEQPPEEETSKREEKRKSVFPDSKMFQMYMEEIKSLPVYTQ